MNAWIFDVDGTLADPTHRRGYVQNKPKRWDLWNKTMNRDGYHKDIFQFMYSGWNLGNKILISTGREESYRDVTLEWLHNNPWFDTTILLDKMFMRKDKDYRSDELIKKEMLDQMREDGYNPVLVFDDRDRVVKMWRENGIRCLQVSEGNF